MDWVEELAGIIEVFPPSGAYAYDETPPLIAPKPANKFVVVKPKNANEVSEILKFASEKRIPVFTRGGGTGLSGGAVPTVEGIVLSTESDEEAEYYGFLSRVRKRIETLFSVAENFGLKFTRAVSRRGLAVKIILGLLAFNFYQLMG